MCCAQNLVDWADNANVDGGEGERKTLGREVGRGRGRVVCLGPGGKGGQCRRSAVSMAEPAEARVGGGHSGWVDFGLAGGVEKGPTAAQEAGSNVEDNTVAAGVSSLLELTLGVIVDHHSTEKVHDQRACAVMAAEAAQKVGESGVQVGCVRLHGGGARQSLGLGWRLLERRGEEERGVDGSGWVRGLE